MVQGVVEGQLVVFLCGDNKQRLIHQGRLHRQSEAAEKPSGCFTSTSLFQGYTLMESFALSVLLGSALEAPDL